MSLTFTVDRVPKWRFHCHGNAKKKTVANKDWDTALPMLPCSLKKKEMNYRLNSILLFARYLKKNNLIWEIDNTYLMICAGHLGSM